MKKANSSSDEEERKSVSDVDYDLDEEFMDDY
jgi:hypothetical protein